MLKFTQPYWMRISIVFLIIASVSGSIVASYSPLAMSVNTDNWMAGTDFTLELHENQNYDTFYDSECTYQDVQLHPKQFFYAFEGDLNAECVYDGGDWKYALTSRRYLGWFFYEYDAKSFIFSVGDSHRMYKISNLTDHIKPIFIPQSKSFAKPIQSSVAGADGLKIYKNILERLTPSDNETYTADLAVPDFVFERSDGLTQPVGRLAASSNGKWLVFDAVNIGIIRLNLDTYEMKRIASTTQLRTIGYDHFARFDISDDGSKVVAAGHGRDFIIYDIDESCGDANLTYYPDKLIALANPCSLRNLGSEVGKLKGGFGYVSEINLRNDDTEIHIWANAAAPYNPFQSGRYILRVNDVVPEFRLDYLALGDSFSSGEGDTEVYKGNKFYLSGTDVDGSDWAPKEKCHVSSRSYPFLLKKTMGLSDDAMQSVTCSGAEIGKDYKVSNDYRGQFLDGSPRLSMLLPYELKEYQESAKRYFIPGRIQQLEFIDRYKPRAITITGGGNDVGFGEVIRSCILSNYYPCTYSSTQSGKAAIGQGIANQYYKLIDLLAQIKKISPDTKIYIVGYPQFVDDESFFCAPNVPVSKNERKMINEAVTYLNKVIESAAIYSGVKFIDIEDSLRGHKLCEKGTAYVTGLALARTIGLGTTVFNSSEQQESFHPNKDGHMLMAKAIRNELNSQSLLQYDNYPAQSSTPGPIKLVSPPEYFAESMASATKSYRKDTITSRQYVQKSSLSGMFAIRFGGFASNSQVRVENHSDPVVLGVYTADENGFITADIPVPENIPAGFHTLHLIGETSSGEAVDIWQGIEVRGKEGDIDEDGIADDIDGCMYVAEIGIDIDNDEIDDACDAMIDAIEPEETLSRDVAVKQIEQDGKDVEQNINYTNNISDTVNVPQEYVERLFYTPHLATPAYVTNDTSLMKTPRYLIGGLVASILILIWIIKRYSSSIRM